MPDNTILLVDDEKLVLATMSEGLRKFGYEVIAASSAKQARQCIADKLPDLAVLDVNMPEETGIELGSWLLTEKGVPFIFLTGYGDKEVVNAGIEAGALSYLVKPIELKQLVPAIEAAIQQGADRHQLQGENVQLQAALDSSRDISIAIGIVMTRQQLTKEQAFEFLRTSARSQRMKLAALSEEIVKLENQRNSILQ